MLFSFNLDFSKRMLYRIKPLNLQGLVFREEMGISPNTFFIPSDGKLKKLGSIKMICFSLELISYESLKKNRYVMHINVNYAGRGC